jgi:hypothetical protein
MSLPAQPNNTDDPTPKKAETKPTEPVKATTPKPTKTVPVPAAPHEPRSYLAMMVLAVFLLPTGLARAYRGEHGGWTRFWTYVAANVIMIIPILGQIIGAIMVLVLSIMGVVDVFKLRKSTTDAFGMPLVASELDKKWAHGFYIYFLVVFIIMAVILALVVIILSYAIQQYQMGGSDFMQQMDASYPNQERYIEPDSF